LNLDSLINPTWRDLLSEYFDSPDKQLLEKNLNEILDSEKSVFPSPKQWFRTFNETQYSKLKVLILGQDPYHTPGKAEGLAFSVPKTESLPPSIRNIYKELISNLKPQIAGKIFSDYSEYLEYSN